MLFHSSTSSAPQAYLVPKYFGSNIIFFTILHFKSKYVQNIFAKLNRDIKTLFSSNFFYKIDTVTLSFIFDKYCPIIELLGSKDSFHKLHVNCAISYFYLYMCRKIRCDSELKKYCKFF